MRLTTRRFSFRRISLALLVLPLALATDARAVTVNTVPVGNPGNAPDQNYSGQGQFGAVGYAYSIGTYEVSNSQYAEFLNAKAASDPFGLYNIGMGDHDRGGISRSGADGGFNYTVRPNMGNKPVNYVSFYDAIRFANWLHNGQGGGDTETGAYTLLGQGPTPSNGSSITRNPGAAWFVPSENEWYKAAFHQPTAQGGDGDNYWFYPTRNNLAPAVATANSVGDINNPGANVANYLSGAIWNGQSGNVTTVGSAGPLSASFYGTFDQGGNLYEWTEEEETFLGSSYRILRGGSWGGNGISLNASDRGGYPAPGAVLEDDSVGFRVATLVPEPASFVLAALGLIGLAAGRWRRMGLRFRYPGRAA